MQHAFAAVGIKVTEVPVNNQAADVQLISDAYFFARGLVDSGGCVVCVSGDKGLDDMLAYFTSLGVYTILVREPPLEPKHRGMVPFRWSEVASAAACRAVLSWAPRHAAPLSAEERLLLSKWGVAACIPGDARSGSPTQLQHAPGRSLAEAGQEESRRTEQSLDKAGNFGPQLEASIRPLDSKEHLQEEAQGSAAGSAASALDGICDDGKTAVNVRGCIKDVWINPQPHAIYSNRDDAGT